MLLLPLAAADVPRDRTGVCGAKADTVAANMANKRCRRARSLELLLDLRVVILLVKLMDGEMMGASTQRWRWSINKAKCLLSR